MTSSSPLGIEGMKWKTLTANWFLCEMLAEEYRCVHILHHSLYHSYRPKWSVCQELHIRYHTAPLKSLRQHLISVWQPGNVVRQCSYLTIMVAVVVTLPLVRPIITMTTLWSACPISIEVLLPEFWHGPRLNTWELVTVCQTDRSQPHSLTNIWLPYIGLHLCIGLNTLFQIHAISCTTTSISLR